MGRKRTGRPPGKPPRQRTRWGDKPNLTAQQWAALAVEYKHLRHLGSDDPSDPPWGRCLREAARAAGQSHTAVRKWRTQPEYWKGIGHLAAKEIVLDPITVPGRPTAAEIRNAKIHLQSYLISNWPGKVESPLNHKVYTDPIEYWKHVTSDPNIGWCGEDSKLPPRRK